MNGIARVHQLQAGGTLSRQQIVDLFLQAASNARQVHNDNIANRQFGRSQWTDFSFEEYFFDTEEGITFETQEAHGVVPGTSIPVTNDDPYFMGELTWSLEVEALVDNCLICYAWPVFEGQNLYSAEDLAMYGGELRYGAAPSGPTDTIAGLSLYGGTAEKSRFCLGGTTTFIGFTGRSYSGVKMFSIGGKFRVIRARMMIRALFR